MEADLAIQNFDESFFNTVLLEDFGNQNLETVLNNANPTKHQSEHSNVNIPGVSA